MNRIKVTVLMPAFNAEKYISEAISSVLEQTFTDFELLIVNDGSTDNTRRIAESFSDPRIIIIDQKNGGVATALSTGLHYSRGEYIARFDSDDICLPNRLNEQVAFLDAHPHYVITGSDAEYIMENGDHLFNFKCLGHTHDEIIAKLYFYCPFIHSAVMFRKDAVIQCGGYSIHAHNCEDYLLWTQLSKLGNFYNLPKSLIKVRINPSSISIDEKWRGENFRKLKRSIIKRGLITEEEGNKLLSIIKSQDVRKIKKGSYYALCGKKFLTDNYQPAKARTQIIKAIRVHPFRWDNYALFMATFFPERIIKWLHAKSPNKL